MKYKYRYEVAEEVLSQNGSNADIQRRVMLEFPDSRPNRTRAQWYRRSWERLRWDPTNIALLVNSGPLSITMLAGRVDLSLNSKIKYQDAEQNLQKKNTG